MAAVQKKVCVFCSPAQAAACSHFASQAAVSAGVLKTPWWHPWCLACWREHCCRDAQVSEVKNIMVDNIEKVLERGEKIELLVDKTDNLRFQASACLDTVV